MERLKVVGSHTITTNTTEYLNYSVEHPGNVLELISIEEKIKRECPNISDTEKYNMIQDEVAKSESERPYETNIEGRDYDALNQNSNTTVGDALERVGLPEPIHDGFDEKNNQG